MANLDTRLRTTKAHSAGGSFGVVAALVAALLVAALVFWFAGGGEEVESGEPEPAARVQSNRLPVDNDPDAIAVPATEGTGGLAVGGDSTVGPIPKDNPDVAVPVE